MLFNWLKLNKAGKTTRPFRYDLNQIPYDYIVEVTNRFKRLDLIDKATEEQWMEVANTVTSIIPKKIEMLEHKTVVWGGLTSSWKRREEKEKHIFNWMHISKEQQVEIRKASYTNNAKK